MNMHLMMLLVAALSLGAAIWMTYESKLIIFAILFSTPALAGLQISRKHLPQIPVGASEPFEFKSNIWSCTAIRDEDYFGSIICKVLKEKNTTIYTGVSCLEGHETGLSLKSGDDAVMVYLFCN